MALMPLVSLGVSLCLLDVSSCLIAVSHASRETNFQNNGRELGTPYYDWKLLNYSKYTIEIFW